MDSGTLLAVPLRRTQRQARSESDGIPGGSWRQFSIGRALGDGHPSPVFFAGRASLSGRVAHRGRVKNYAKIALQTPLPRKRARDFKTRTTRSISPFPPLAWGKG